MKKHLIASSALLAITLIASAQSAMDGYNFSQPDLKGTARYMSMGGAFGALGGDLSTLSQNPAGIGVYRHSEIGFTVDLDCQSSSTQAPGNSMSDAQTKFLLNNIGGVLTWRLNSSAIPNLNFGFTYNKASSFNRRYSGGIGGLQTSLSNYVAGLANGAGYSVPDLETVSGEYDPYNPPSNQAVVPQWLPILGYNSFMISPEGDENYPEWNGQYGAGTSGNGYFNVSESGAVNEYNLALGGNINNVVYWGMDFGIISMNYNQWSSWAENLNNAYVDGDILANNSWKLNNSYSASGSGFNYKLGIIIKPIQEFRLGFAFHTPTWYSIDEVYSGSVNYNNPQDNFNPATTKTNNGVPGANYYNFRTPWRFMVSAAGVIGNRLILSADFEWQPMRQMQFSDQNYYGWDDWDYGGNEWDNSWGYDWGWFSPSKNQGGAATRSAESFSNTNNDIREYYQTSYNLRIGAEFRVTNRFSVRAGYNYVTSPVTEAARDNNMTIYTVGTNPAYRFDNTTNYVTCGLGYKLGGFYADLAYVYKHISSEYHAFTPDPGSGISSPTAKMSLTNNQIVLSMGYKF